MAKRMFHPSLDTFVDVDDRNVDDYAEAGWLKTQPKHVHIPEGTPKPGEGPGIARVFQEVPVLESTSGTTTSRSRGTGSRASTGGSRGGSASTGTSSTATGSTPSA